MLRREGGPEMLFEESLIVTLPKVRKGRVGWFFAATVLGYGVVGLALLITSILLVNPQLKDTFTEVALLAPPPPPPPPPPPAAASPQAQVPSGTAVTNAFVPPTEIPRELPNVSDLPSVSGGSMAVAGGVPGGVPGGSLGGVLGGVLGAIPTAVAAPPPPPVNTEVASVPVKPRPVSRGILLGNSLRRVTASYPPAARAARIQDTVEVEVVIDVNGNVASARAVSGNPLLRKAATEAAMQWKFRPTLLNGRPTQITGVLSFNFQLSS